MLNNAGIVTFTTAAGFHALIKYEMSGDFWIKDISADEWYFSSFNEGGRFQHLIEGEACCELRQGEEVKDKGLLMRLHEAKNQYIESSIAN
jgi:hypothetical protein